MENTTNKNHQKINKQLCHGFWNKLKTMSAKFDVVSKNCVFLVFPHSRLCVTVWCALVPLATLYALSFDRNFSRIMKSNTVPVTLDNFEWVRKMIWLLCINYAPNRESTKFITNCFHLHLLIFPWNSVWV